ncbi:hypothetical protein DB31_2810 [Hyalangium minutum]|uniref:Uncharacterized protein n=1 Tax=Hyalangium minutum TaxID=394096 RepID=A0A085W6A4_9BACT|nr:hypothetical protein DB31_2810 [Hyalangium minutum]
MSFHASSGGKGAPVTHGTQEGGMRGASVGRFRCPLGPSTTVRMQRRLEKFRHGQRAHS